MRTTKQKIFLGLKIAFVSIVLLIGTFYYFRDEILQKVIVKASNKLLTEYNSKIVLKSATFNGLSGVDLKEVALIPIGKDTLFRFKNVKTKLSFLGFIKGDFQLDELKADNGFIHLIKTENGSNYEQFLSNKSDTLDENVKTNYAKIAYNLLNKALNLVPTDMEIQNFELLYDDKGNKTSFETEKLVLDNEDLETTIHIKSEKFTQNLRIKGTADPRDRVADIRFYNVDKGKIIVPYVTEKYGLKSSFDSIRVKVDNIEMSGDELHIDGVTEIQNVLFNHRKVSNNDVVFNNIKLDYKLLFGENFVALDEGSLAEINKIIVKPYLKYEKLKSKIFTIKATIPSMKAQDFFTSLPEGLFQNFAGMQVAGNFSYAMSFKMDKSRPWALSFSSNMNKSGLKILKYGAADLGKLNSEFEYAALINNVRQRSIKVGVENPDYYPLSEISPNLKKSVLSFEDPTFYSHKGFVLAAFRASIAKNMADNKFSRGGSTISMQLIKNVFLKREKTLSRKLEEILLCYVMENNNIVSKDRMLEVYFNIIEWGPDVYGIGEASRFYFQKKPIDLTLNECLFLASIVPMPQKFMNQFDGIYWKSKFARRAVYMKNAMLKRGILLPEEVDSTSYFNLTGKAKSFLKPTEKQLSETKIDSIEVPVDDQFEF